MEGKPGNEAGRKSWGMWLHGMETPGTRLGEYM